MNDEKYSTFTIHSSEKEKKRKETERKKESLPGFEPRFIGLRAQRLDQNSIYCKNKYLIKIMTILLCPDIDTVKMRVGFYLYLF